MYYIAKHCPGAQAANKVHLLFHGSNEAKKGARAKNASPFCVFLLLTMFSCFFPYCCPNDTSKGAGKSGSVSSVPKLKMHHWSIFPPLVLETP